MDTNQIIINDFLENHPFAAGQTIEQFSDVEVSAFFEKRSAETTLHFFGLMNPKKVADCFVLMPTKKKTELIESGDPNLIVSFLKHVEQPILDSLLLNVSSTKRGIIKLKMNYFPNSVGALMESAISIPITMSVDEAIQLTRNSVQKEEFYLYVVDSESNYKGIVRPKELLLAATTEKVGNIMKTKIAKISPDVQIKTILAHTAWSDYHYLPVVNKAEKLLGTLSHKTVIKASQETNTTADNEIQQTGGALGELYSIGLTGLLKSLGKQ